MLEVIIIAFTLKGQDFQKIKEAIAGIHQQHDSNVILVHGFMPRKEVVERGFPTDVVDTLEENFPVQLNMYNGGPLRSQMLEVAKKLDAKIYVIGEIKEGVKEEVDLYKSNGLSITEVGI